MSFLYGWFQARLKEAASLEKHVLLKKLRDALEALRGHVTGKNKDDVVEAILMVSLMVFSPSYLSPFFAITIVCPLPYQIWTKIYEWEVYLF